MTNFLMGVGVFLMDVFRVMVAGALLAGFAAIGFAMAVGFVHEDQKKFGSYEEWFQNRYGKFFFWSWLCFMAYMVHKWRLIHGF